ncbi:MAG: zinc ribbon domain-containing protein [Clostridiales bacterium]|nr:zinc ribbon domain-containing protein [Clostridiales bacterium]
MFCKNCGSQLPEGTVFCSKCGCRTDAEPNSAYESQQQSQQYQSQPQSGQFQQYQSHPQPEQFQQYQSVPDPSFYGEPPKKRKKAPFIIGGAAAAAAVIGGVCIANASTISGFVKRTFYSPEKYYQQVEEEAMKETTNALAESYDLYLEELKKIQASGNQNVELSLRLEDGGRSLLGTVIPADLSWLDEVSIKADSFTTESTMESVVEVYLNESILGSLAVAGDWELQELYMKIPELSASYLGVDLEQLSSEYGAAFPDISEFSQPYTDVAEFFPDGESLETLISKYYTPLLANVTEVTKTREEVTVGSITQKATVLEAEIQSADFYQSAFDILGQLKSDADVERIIRTSVRTFIQQAQAMDVYGEIPDEDTVYQEFVTVIEDLESDLRLAQEENRSNPFVLNKIWVDNSGQIIGRALTIGASGETIPLFSYLCPEDGKNFELEGSFYAGDTTLGFTGKGTTDGSKINSTCTVSIDSTPLLTIGIEDMDSKKTKEGTASGSITLRPEAGLAAFAGDAGTGALLTNYSLKMTVQQDKETSSADLTLLSADVPMFTLSANVSLNGTGKQAMPASNDKVYNAASEEDVFTYLTEISLEDFLANLRASDIPSEYLDSLEYSIMEFSEMLEYYSGY